MTAFRDGDLVIADSGGRTVRGRVRGFMWKVDTEDGATIIVNERQLRRLYEGNVVSLPLRLPQPVTVYAPDDGGAA
jgi:hypothetical protein